jgi:Tol biopolymer transport system component
MTRTPLPSRSRPARSIARAATVLLVAAACGGDGTGPVTPPVVVPKPEFPVPGGALAAFDCTADVQPAAVACAPAEGAPPPRVGLSATNVALAGGVMAFDVAVSNPMVFRLGTADGATVAGIEVSFAAGPTVTGGTGAVDVRNAAARSVDGQQQAYYLYDGTLATGQSAARRWELAVPAAATRFTFRVYVQAPLLPVVLLDRVVDGNRDVWRVALDGGDLVRMTTHGAEEMSATAGGGTLVYTSYRHGNGELYAMPLAGGAETRLTTSGANETEPALNRAGTRLAYVSDASGVGKVFVAAANGGGAARAAAGDFGLAGIPEGSPAWFPGGERLAFVGTAQGTADVFGLEGAGSTPALLAGGVGAELTPAVSPDGTMLSYASNTPGNTEIFVLTLATGAATRLTTRPGADAAGSWTPDGRIVYLAYTDTGNEVRWINPATGAGGLVLSGGSRATEVLRPFAVPY